MIVDIFVLFYNGAAYVEKKKRLHIEGNQVVFSDLLNDKAIDFDRMKGKLEYDFLDKVIIGESWMTHAKIDYNCLPFYSFDVPYFEEQHYSRIHPVLDSCDFFEVDGVYYIRINYFTDRNVEGYHCFYRMDIDNADDSFDLRGDAE